MKRLLWTLVAVCISTGVYFTIRYGLRPKPIPVLNPTEFTDLEQLGVVVYKYLRQNVRAERLVLLGSRRDVPDEARVWLGFLKAAAADKERIVFFARPGLEVVPPTPGLWETVPFDEALVASGELLTRVKERIKAGSLAVVPGRTDEVTHLVAGSLARRFEVAVSHPVLSISTLRFAVNAQEQDELQPQCLDTGEDPDGQRRLACAARRVARKFARKALDPKKAWGAMERHGLKEYLVFVHQP